MKWRLLLTTGFILIFFHVLISAAFYKQHSHRNLLLFAAIVAATGYIFIFWLYIQIHGVEFFSHFSYHALIAASTLNLCRMFRVLKEYPYSTELIIFIVVFFFVNIVRVSFLHRIKSNFASDERLQWHEDVIQLERFFLKARDGGDVRSNREIIEEIRNSPRKLDPKAYFCRFCDDPVLNSLADDFELLNIVKSGYEREDVSLESLTASSLTSGIDSRSAAYAADIDQPGAASEELASFMGLRDISPSATYPTEPLVELLDVSKRDLKWLSSHGLLVDLAASRPSPFSSSKNKPMITMSKLKRLIALERTKMRGTVTQDSIALVLSESEAATVFKLLSRDFDTALNFKKFKENMRQVNNERGNLVSTLQNNQEIIRTINNSMIALEIIFLVALYFCIFSSTSFYFRIISAFFVLLFSIIWNTMSSFIFIISTHPYDVGDRIHVEDENLIVRYIGLTCTLFERWNNEFVVISNEYMRKHPIKNIRRSKSQQWRIEFFVSNKTPSSTLSKLTRSLVSFVDKSAAFEHVTVAVEEIAECMSYKLVFIVRHAINHQNGFFMWQVQNKFMTRLVEECQRFGIQYVQPEIHVM